MELAQPKDGVRHRECRGNKLGKINDMAQTCANVVKKATAKVLARTMENTSVDDIVNGRVQERWEMGGMRVVRHWGREVL